MNRFKKLYPRQDELTHEWFFNGQWYDYYPAKEVEENHSMYDEWMERKFDEQRDNKLRK